MKQTKIPDNSIYIQLQKDLKKKGNKNRQYITAKRDVSERRVISIDDVNKVAFAKLFIKIKP